MQLNRKRKGASIAATLSVLAGNLLGTGAAQAQDNAHDTPSIMAEAAPGVGTTTVDTAVLFYQERGGRVQAIEPTISVTANQTDGDIFTGSFTYDSLTGATPNGATPWTIYQTISMAYPAPATQTTTTSASGSRTVVSHPGEGYVTSSYNVPANTLPVDPGFNDHRTAGTFGYSMLATPNTRVKFGLAASFERDYESYSANVGFSQDLNQKATTLALGINVEFDVSKPFYGTPAPLTSLRTPISGGNDSKTVVSVVGGITQTMARFWLAQLNFSYGKTNGYQSDPYKFLSIINADQGYPMDYAYESRPRARTRESVYFGNKLALGPTVADLSVRYYHDNWGIDSITAEASERIPLSRTIYIEPSYRYYHQTAADFFRYYLVNGAPLPTYASADGRLARFHARTLGLKLGMRLTRDIHFYIDGEDYKQDGTHYLTDAPGKLATMDVFSGVHAYSIMSGFRFNL